MHLYLNEINTCPWIRKKGGFWVKAVTTWSLFLSPQIPPEFPLWKRLMEQAMGKMNFPVETESFSLKAGWPLFIKFDFCHITSIKKKKKVRFETYSFDGCLGILICFYWLAVLLVKVLRWLIWEKKGLRRELLKIGALVSYWASKVYQKSSGGSRPSFANFSYYLFFSKAYQTYST